MRALRLVAVPLLASMWIATGVAQSGVVQSAQSQPDQSPLAIPAPSSLQTMQGTHRFSLNAAKALPCLSRNRADQA